MKFLSKNASHILWAAVVVFIFLLLKCQSDKKSERLKQIQTEAARLQVKHKADSVAFISKEQRWQDSIYNAGLNSDMQVKVIKEIENKLSNTRYTIERLADRIKNGPPITDTSQILLVPDYAKTCDSLADLAKTHLKNIDQKDSAINDLVDLMNYEIIYRDSLIEAGNTYRDSLRVDYNKQKGLLNEALKVGKPRGRLLGGVGLIGNEPNPLSGTKINIAYQSKGGKQYQVGGILLRGQVYYEAGVLITLIK